MIHILFGDITSASVDAIVNAAKPSLLGGEGVDGAIHRAAGPDLLRECRALPTIDACDITGPTQQITIGRGPVRCNVGSSVVTGAGLLQARNVIHTVGPLWSMPAARSTSLLVEAYKSAFRAARIAGAATIALPAISAGAYGFPIDIVATYALLVGRAHDEFFTDIYFYLWPENVYLTFLETSACLDAVRDVAG